MIKGEGKSPFEKAKNRLNRFKCKKGLGICTRVCTTNHLDKSSIEGMKY
jgi:hypothetical protein